MNKALLKFMLRRVMWVNIIFAAILLIGNLSDVFMIPYVLDNGVFKALAWSLPFAFIIVFSLRGSSKSNQFFYYSHNFSDDTIFLHLGIATTLSLLIALLPVLLITLTPLRWLIMSQWDSEAYRPLFMQWKDSWQLIEVFGGQYLLFSVVFHYQWIRGMFTKQKVSGALFTTFSGLVLYTILEMSYILEINTKGEFMNYWLLNSVCLCIMCMMLIVSKNMHRKMEVGNV